MDWTKETYEIQVKEKLVELVDSNYQLFTSRLLPGTEHILGVRLPKLRLLAKEIAKDDWQSYLKAAQDNTLEEIMLQGMVIGAAKAEIEDIIPYIRSFVPKINNWSVCDSFCSGLKITKQNKIEMWKVISEYVQSNEEYELRFAVVMFLDYYIEPDYLQLEFEYFDQIPKEKYYVSMAVAWAISICFITYENETMNYLKHNQLDSATYHKALQKIVESTRVSKDMKDKIRAMKR